MSMEVQKHIFIFDHMYVYIYMYIYIYVTSLYIYIYSILHIRSMSHYTIVTWQADGAVKIEDKEFALVQAQEQRAVNSEQRRTDVAPTTNKFHQVRS